MPWKTQLTCPRCGKRYRNPLTHVCANSGDFAKRQAAGKHAAAAAERKRKAAAQRAKVNARVAAARKQERAKADARVARAKAARRSPAARRRDAHNYRTCRDDGCQLAACEAYREGYADGIADATTAEES